MTRSAPLIDRILEGIKASGVALLEESRRTGRPLVTCRDGKVVQVDADGNIVVGPLVQTDPRQ